MALILPVPGPGDLGAQTTSAIAGTAHDFAPEGGATNDGCPVCHLLPEDGGSKGGTVGMGRETLLCLSCHDGVNASSTGTASATHPSSTAYVAGEGYRAVEDVEASGARLPTQDGGPRVECTSCHDPHDNVFGSFLRVSRDGSALCFACHIK